MDNGIEIQPGDVIEIPIFPLPNVVFFPNTVLPLHIFEPRYRQMTREALEGTRQIGMCLLKYGREDPTQPQQDSYSIGGMGVISEVQEYPDGSFNLMLAGMSRFRMLSLIRLRPYRCARVMLLEDSAGAREQTAEVARQVLNSYAELSGFRDEGPDLSSLEKLDSHSLINLIGMSLNIGIHSKQSLLEIGALEKRGRLVLHLLQSLIQQERVVQSFSHLRVGDPSAN